MYTNEPNVIEYGRYCISESHSFKTILIDINIFEPVEDLEIPFERPLSLRINGIQINRNVTSTLERILGISSLFKAVDIVSYTPDNLSDIINYIHTYNEFISRSVKVKKNFPNAIIAPTTSTEREIVRKFIERYDLLNFNEHQFKSLIYRFGMDNIDVLKYIVNNVKDPEVQKHYQSLIHERIKKDLVNQYGYSNILSNIGYN